MSLLIGPDAAMAFHAGDARHSAAIADAVSHCVIKSIATIRALIKDRFVPWLCFYGLWNGWGARGRCL